MKRLIKLLILGSLAIPFIGKANDIEPGKEFYTAVRAPRPVVLDGILDEWSGAPILADPRFAVPKGSGPGGVVKGDCTQCVDDVANPNYVLFEPYGGTWSGPDDQTSAVQVTYDDNNVYFAFTVTDDTHENAANSAWNGDSVQLMIANADRDTQVALYNYALGGVDGKLGSVIVNHEAGPGGTDAIVTRDASKKKTYYEIKLPAESLGLTAPLTAGTKFGLGMSINDGDTQPGQAGQKGWGGLGAHAIVFGKHPQETALVTLGASQTTVEVLGIGTAALLRGDLTDPEDDGKDAAGAATDPSWNWASIDSSVEPDFEGGENAFNIFDNKVGGGNDKWCCDDPTADNPVWVAVQFKNPVSLTHFTVASGNDAADRDPTDWAIQGSSDGTTYTDIYHFKGSPALWTARNQVLKFTLPSASPQYKYVRYIAWETPGTLHQLNEIEYFGTIGGADRLFLSAINPSFTKLSFRATDVAASVVDPKTAKLTIDNVNVPLTYVKTGTATDFTGTYTRLASGSTHNYAIEVKDALGNAVTASAPFTLPTAVFPAANLPSPAAKSKTWNVRYVFGTGEQIGDLATSIAALTNAGTASFVGSVIDTTSDKINFNGGGYFPNNIPYPDNVTTDPNWTGDDFVLLSTGNIEITEESDYTFGVHSDDGFALRIRGAEVKSVSGNGQADPADPEAVIHPATTGDSNTRAVYHLRPGVYRVEFFWFERGGGDNGELYAAKGAFISDSDTTSWRLLGDNAASQTFSVLGVDANGWTVISSDPNGADQINSWDTANAALAATGGKPTQYDQLNVGDPDTNAGVLPFPKNTSADDNDYVLKATAKLVVPADGTYVIGFNSDDGAYMKVAGKNFIEILQNATGSSVLDGDTVTCDCLTGDSGTTATITLTKGTYDIEVGMFERGGGSFLSAKGAQQGSPQLPILAKNGAGSFTTGQAILLTDKPTGQTGGGSPTMTVTRSGNTLTISWTPTGGTLETSPTLGAGATWTTVGNANPATVNIGTGKAAFYRVKQ